MSDDISTLKRRLANQLDQSRQRLLDATKGVPSDQVINESWTLHDVLGHIAVWDLEAVRSLRAYNEGNEYSIPSLDFNDFSSTDRYNQSAADERAVWNEDQIHEELESAREAFKQMIHEIPDDRYPGNMLFPWGPHGTIEQLVIEMIIHEEEHAAAIQAVSGKAGSVDTD